jgi:hypothetical protein
MKFLTLLLFSSLFADSITLENKSTHPKIAVQWASSARVAQDSNDALMQGDPLPKDLYYPRKEISKITIPANASYFRIVAWDSKNKNPDYLTNWVEIVPDKTYEIDDEHLTPVLLMNGMGC